MGYTDTQGRWIDTTDVTLLAQSTETSSDTSDPIELGDKAMACLDLVCSSRSGTNPTLDVAVQTCDTKDGTFRSVGSFTQVTAAGSQRKSFVGLDRWVRLSWTIGGTSTPTFAFYVSGEAK